MPRSTVVIVATFVASIVCSHTTFAQAVAQQAKPVLPAIYRGGADPRSCLELYPGSFLDIGKSECWQCPSTHPSRTIFTVTGRQACERPAGETFRKASGPERPTGLIGTNCRSGWFLDIGKGACYSCDGYNRTAHAVTHPRACSRAVPAAWTTAIRRGPPGCPAGAFKHGLTGRCYSCPVGYMRNLVIADDLTKVNACTRLSTTVRDETHAKFEQRKNDHAASRDNLGRTARSVRVFDYMQTFFDQASRDQMKTVLEYEIAQLSGFQTVSWLVSLGGSVGGGYSHGTGYAMTKVGDTYRCRKAWSNAFTAGLSTGAGVIIEIGLSRGEPGEGLTETNGWQSAAAFPPVSAGAGMHWDAGSPAVSMTLTFGPGFMIDVNFAEYVHTWSEIGKVVPCDRMTWGTRWASL